MFNYLWSFVGMAYSRVIERTKERMTQHEGKKTQSKKIGESLDERESKK